MKSWYSFAYGLTGIAEVFQTGFSEPRYGTMWRCPFLVAPQEHGHFLRIANKMCNIQNSNNVKENKFPDLETVEIDSSRGTSGLFNSDRGLIPLADRWNRNVISNITHQVASDNLKFYREGKISGFKLFSRLKLHTVGGGRLITLLRYLGSEQDNKFVKWYTFGKVKDFFYDEFERSIIERSSTNIAIGLVTLPRNSVEACYYQVIKPIIRGVFLKNLVQVYEGIENFVGILVGLYVVLFCYR